jgi:2-methylcitrate dehydratase PrpD
MAAESLNAAVARWVASLRPDDLPGEVAESTKLRLLDLVGVMLAARGEGLVAQAKAASLAVDGGGGARILGDAEDVPPMTAAFVNGVLTALLEFDDTHIESFVHPTAPCVAVALAEATRRPVSGRALVAAIAAGSEMACRLGLVPAVRLHNLGFHPTAVFGGFAGVYTLAVLRGLPAPAIADAIGHAASLAAGINASFEDGSSTKMLHVGMAATGALRAVALAEAGIAGPDPAYDGRFGWFRSHVQGRDDHRFAAVTDRLGERWEALAIASKVHPCAFTMMPHIACALALRAEHGIRPEQVARIVARIGRRSFATMCEPVADKRRPATTWHGRISLQHTVAEALVRGRMDKGAYAEAALRDPVINALADLVEHEDDPATVAQRSGGEVIVTLHDGRVLSHRIADMPGTPANPLPAEAIVAKFHANAAGVLAEDRAAAAVERILRIEEAEDVRPVLAGLEA